MNDQKAIIKIYVSELKLCNSRRVAVAIKWYSQSIEPIFFFYSWWLFWCWYWYVPDFGPYKRKINANYFQGEESALSKKKRKLNRKRNRERRNIKEDTRMLLSVCMAAAIPIIRPHLDYFMKYRELNWICCLHIYGNNVDCGFTISSATAAGPSAMHVFNNKHVHVILMLIKNEWERALTRTSLSFCLRALYMCCVSDMRTYVWPKSNQTIKNDT